MSAELAVEVAWSPAAREMRQVSLRLEAGARLGDALRATGWPGLGEVAADDAALAAAGLAVAIWGKTRSLDAPLRDGDRVEVLRALVVAPMEARRERYERAGGVKALRQAPGRKR